LCDAAAGHTHYCDFQGDPELRRAIADFYLEEYGLAVSDEQIFVTAGASVAMHLVLEAILNDGDEVIMQAPYFTPYPDQIRLSRGVPVELPTCEQNGFRIDPLVLESLITPCTRALIINYPNNPTGACFRRKDLEQIAEIAIRYDLIIISDEIYTSYSYQVPFIPMIAIHGMRERTITINSFSKNYNMTGWRAGFVLATACLVTIIRAIDGSVTFTASSISQRAAINALRYRHEIQPPIIDEYQSRVMYAAKRVNGIPHMSVPMPQGTFYLFVNIKGTGRSSEEISRRILEQAHVLTLPGIGFGKCGEGYLRIACTVPVDKLREAFDRIERVDI